MTFDPVAEGIYGDLLAQCRPWPLPGPWSRFQDPQAYSGPVDPDVAWEQLQDEHDAAVLLAARIAVPGAGQELLWNPVLSAPDSCLVALRSDPKKPPFDVLTPAGCLSGGSLPALAALNDRPAGPGPPGSDRMLLVAFSLPDVVVLRAIGQRCTLATGLDGLAGKSLGEVCRRFGWRKEPAGLPQGQQAGHVPPGNKSVEMIFVDWSPAALACASPAGLGIVRSHFTNIQHGLQIFLADVGSWKPSESERQRIEFCLRHGELADLQNAVESSLDESGTLFLAPEDGSPEDADTPPELQTAVTRMCHGTDGQGARSAWNDAVAALDRDINDPLLEKVLGIQDPEQRSVKLAAANSCRLVHYQILRMILRFGASLREDGPGRSEPIPLGELQKLKAILSELTRQVSGETQSRGSSGARNGTGRRTASPRR